MSKNNVPAPPKNTHEKQYGNTTLDVDERNVIISRVIRDDQGNVTYETRTVMRWWRGES